MSQPLSGLRVVDLSALGGAYGTRLMAALGAEVIKVEPPGGSPLRGLAPFAESAPDGEASLWWAFLAMGTKSVELDPETDDGRAAMADLLRGADIVVDEHGPDVLDELGLGYDDVSADNPGVIWVSITPFGLTGSKRSWSTSNLVAWAASSILYTVGFEDQPPANPGGPVQMAMHATALNATVGALMALRVRRATGRGQQVDLAISESALAIAPETTVPVFLDDQVHRVRTGNRRALSRPFGIYPCADGYVSILVLMPHHWAAMAEWVHEVTGNETIIEDVFADVVVRGESMELIDMWTEELTMQLSALEVFEEGQRRGIPITPVNTVEALRNDPHLAATGFWQQGEMPDGATVEVPGAPFRTSAAWWATSRAPLLGEHSAEILS